MREIGRQRRLRWPTSIGLAAMLAVAVGGASLVATTSASASSSNGHCGGPTIKVEPFGSPVADTPFSSTPEQTFRFTLTNCHGMQIRLLTYGAITQSITVPDRRGHLKNVALGFATLQDYIDFVSPPPTSPNFGGPYFGETIGRYGNRIANGKFPLNNTTYTLPVNNGPNSLHGGFVGFGNHIWHTTAVAKTRSSVSVTLKLVSPNGDEGSGLIPGTKVYEANCSIPANPPTTCTGYPAQLSVWVTFTLDNHNRYWLSYRAHNDDRKLSTVLNLTNHTYFNLAGEASGSALNQLVQMNANTFTPTNNVQIPTGAITPVSQAPQFDFTHFKPIFPSIADCTGGPASLGCSQLLIGQGFDHNWVLNKQTPFTTGPAGLNLAARALDPRSGRLLTVWTDQPGVQFYTSNFLNGKLVGISGHIYRQGQAYTFETQHYPDSPNQPSFPSTELKAGQTFKSTTIFAFSS